MHLTYLRFAMTDKTGYKSFRNNNFELSVKIYLMYSNNIIKSRAVNFNHIEVLLYSYSLRLGRMFHKSFFQHT